MENTSNEKEKESIEFTRYLLEIKNNENKFAERFSKTLIESRLAQLNLCKWISVSA